MGNSKNDGKEYDYIKEITEWQENQYNPGHYTGGRIPPYLIKPGKPKMLGWIFIIPSIVGVLIFLLKLVIDYRNMSIVDIISLGIPVLGVATLCIIAGIRMLKNDTNTNKE